MRALLTATLLAFCALCAAQPTAPTSTQLDALMALARVHGVVRYFQPSDSLDRVAWDRFLVHAAERMGSVDDGSQIAPRLEELYAPIVEGFGVGAAGREAKAPGGEGPRVEWRHLGYGMEPDPNSPYVSWRTHHDPLHGAKIKGPFFQHRAQAEASVHADPVMRIDVGAGLEAHVPVSLPLSATQLDAARQQRLDALARNLAATAPAGESVIRAQAHADGIALWNVARHFYPYWAGSKVDWDAELRQWLARQPAAQRRDELVRSLGRLASPLDDGHVRIVDPADKTPRAFLPASIRPVDERFVVDASQAPDKLRVGDVIVAVNGKPVKAWFEERAAALSGSPQYKRWRVAQELVSGAKDATLTLRLARGKAVVGSTIAFDAPRPMQGPRAAPLQELRPGIRYVDASRFDRGAFEKALETLAQAKGIVFDARGYPSRDAQVLVSYWLTGEDTAQWMLVPRFDRPFAEATTGWSIGWQLRRDARLEKPRKVLLVDARTIDYAESLAAYFPAQKTGPLVGEPTAGADGNVARATLPSAMAFFFTAMRVTAHDGVTVAHGKGIAPDVRASPTVEGVSAGRDELLERAISILEAPPGR